MADFGDAYATIKQAYADAKKLAGKATPAVAVLVLVLVTIGGSGWLLYYFVVGISKVAQEQTQTVSSMLAMQRTAMEDLIKSSEARRDADGIMTDNNRQRWEAEEKVRQAEQKFKATDEELAAMTARYDKLRASSIKLLEPNNDPAVRANLICEMMSLDEIVGALGEVLTPSDVLGLQSWSLRVGSSTVCESISARSERKTLLRLGTGSPGSDSSYVVAKSYDNVTGNVELGIMISASRYGQRGEVDVVNVGRLAAFNIPDVNSIFDEVGVLAVIGPHKELVSLIPAGGAGVELSTRSGSYRLPLEPAEKWFESGVYLRTSEYRVDEGLAVAKARSVFNEDSVVVSDMNDGFLGQARAVVLNIARLKLTREFVRTDQNTPPYQLERSLAAFSGEVCRCHTVLSAESPPGIMGPGRVRAVCARDGRKYAYVLTLSTDAQQQVVAITGIENAPSPQ